MHLQPAETRLTCSYCCQALSDQNPGRLVERHVYLVAVTAPVPDPRQPSCVAVQLAPDIVLCSPCCQRFGYPLVKGAELSLQATEVATELSAGQGAGGGSSVGIGGSRERCRQRGRPAGSPTAEADRRLYEDWKAAQVATGITKREFLRERSLPLSRLAAIERGRAQQKRERPGRNPLDERPSSDG
jgi:hypothetical protein